MSKRPTIAPAYRAIGKRACSLTSPAHDLAMQRFLVVETAR